MFNQFEEVISFFKNNSFSEEQLQTLKKLIIDKYKSKELVQSAFTQIDLNVLKYKLTPINEIKHSKVSPHNELVSNIEKKELVINSLERTRAYDINVKPYQLVKLNIVDISALLDIEKEVIYKVLTGSIPNKSIIYSNYSIPTSNVAKILIKRLERINLNNITENENNKHFKVKLDNKKIDKKANKTCEDKTILSINYRNKEFICNDLLTSIRFINRMLKQKKIPISKGDYFTEVEYKALKGFIKSRRKEINRQSKIIKSVNLPTKIRAKRKSRSGSGVYGRIEKYGGVGKLIYIRSR